MRYIVSCILSFVAVILFFALSQNIPGTITFGVGVLFGMGVLFFDEHYAYKKYAAEDPSIPLASRSTLFLLSMIPLGLYITTSTGSIFGQAAILGMSYLLVGEFLQFKKNSHFFQQRFLSQLTLQLSPDAAEYVTILGIFYATLLSLIVFL